MEGETPHPINKSASIQGVINHGIYLNVGTGAAHKEGSVPEFERNMEQRTKDDLMENNQILWVEGLQMLLRVSITE